MRQARPINKPVNIARRIWIFAFICFAALILTGLWSGSIYQRESRHTGEPLPVFTVQQVVVSAILPLYFHLKDAAPQFSPNWVDDHYCHRIECVDLFMALVTPGTRPGQPVQMVSRIRTFPGDVNERRNPFNVKDPVLEGRLDPDKLWPDEIKALRAEGIVVNADTLVFDRVALHGRVPPADSVDVLVPWFVGLPVALVSGLMIFSLLRYRRLSQA